MSARGDKDSSIIAAMFRLPVVIGAASLNLFLSPLRVMMSAMGQPATPNAAAGPGSQTAPGPQAAPQASGATGAAPETDLVRDTVNGLIAFVIPGPDTYSIAQGMSTKEPGGIDAAITDPLIAAMNLGQPHPPQGPLPSESAAALLNQVAAQIGPSSAGSFVSPFARLSFAQKAAVFQFLETDPSMVPFRRLAALLLFLPAAAAYSEGGAFDLASRRVVGWPVGWSISGYSGVADGRDEFKGYFQGRREPLGVESEEEDLEEDD